MTHAETVSALATERYLLDEMTAPERDAFEAHYFECLDCAEDVQNGAHMQEGVKAGLLGPITASPLALVTAQTRTPTVVTRPWYRSTVVPWAVAATLAVAVGYQQVPSRPGGNTDTIAALTPTVLRPASRGAAPVVSGAGGHLALALDLDSEGAAELAYVLRTADGRALVSGTSAVPPTGSPLVLVVPTFTMTARQQYSLSVNDAARPDRSFGEFTFIMGASR